MEINNNELFSGNRGQNQSEPIKPKNISSKDKIQRESNDSNLKTKETNKGLNRLKSLMKLGQNIPYETENNRLKLTFWGYLEYICTILFCLRKSPKHQIISKAEKAFKHDLDIVNIVEKLHDLEKLKILLLNEDQLLLFNYLSKPLISFNEKERTIQEDNLNQSNIKMSKLMNFSDISKTGNNIAESYRRIYENKNADKTNLRLAELFDQKVCSWRK